MKQNAENQPTDRNYFKCTLHYFCVFFRNDFAFFLN